MGEAGTSVSRLAQLLAVQKTSDRQKGFGSRDRIFFLCDGRIAPSRPFFFFFSRRLLITSVQRDAFLLFPFEFCWRHGVPRRSRWQTFFLGVVAIVEIF